MKIDTQRWYPRVVREAARGPGLRAAGDGALGEAQWGFPVTARPGCKQQPPNLHEFGAGWEGSHLHFPLGTDNEAAGLSSNTETPQGESQGQGFVLGQRVMCTETELCAVTVGARGAQCWVQELGVVCNRSSVSCATRAGEPKNMWEKGRGAMARHQVGAWKPVREDTPHTRTPAEAWTREAQGGHTGESPRVSLSPDHTGRHTGGGRCTTNTFSV